MGRKRKSEETGAAAGKTKVKITKGNKKDRVKEEGEDSEGEHHENEEEMLEMPPTPILYKLVDRLESLLPKDDTVKYDSR